MKAVPLKVMKLVKARNKTCDTMQHITSAVQLQPESLNVVMVVFGQATGAVHVSIVDLILPDTPCFPFSAFQFHQFLQTELISSRLQIRTSMA